MTFGRGYEAADPVAGRGEHVEDLRPVPADPRESGERADQQTDMFDDVLNADGTVRHAVREPLDPRSRGLNRVGEPVGQRLQRGVDLVDHRGEHVEHITQRIQRGRRRLLAETAQRGFDVRQCSGECLAGGQCGSAEILVHRGGERPEVDLARRDHVGHVLRADAQLVGERLQDGHATRRELEHVIALKLAACHHASEDRARVGKPHAGDLRGVADGLQHLGELFARFDT